MSIYRHIARYGVIVYNYMIELVLWIIMSLSYRIIRHEMTHMMSTQADLGLESIHADFRDFDSESLFD